MATWKSIEIIINGNPVKAQAPLIVTASRSTDIPAFYADWFFGRLEKGYSAWINPFNGVKSYVSYENTRFIVFWSKNPFPLLNHLDELEARNIGCYIQYTLNDYEAEGLEKGVPPLAFRIDTFKKLVDRLGKGRVIWRFDPMILTDTISIDSLLEKVERIGDQLVGYTEKLVFSFADILSYRKVKANLDKSHISYQDWTEPQMLEFAERLAALGHLWRENRLKTAWHCEESLRRRRAYHPSFLRRQSSHGLPESHHPSHARCRPFWQCRPTSPRCHYPPQRHLRHSRGQPRQRPTPVLRMHQEQGYWRI